MTRNGVIENYEQWLMVQVQVNAETHGKLCHILQDTAFEPIIEMDENRSEDGMRLRMEYSDEISKDESEAELICDQIDCQLGSCTILELLVVLARMMEYEMLDSQYEAGVGKWFMELLMNLGIEDLTDEQLIFHPGQLSILQERLYKFIYRKYDWDGEGGLFPLMYAQGDQRRTELAIQMNRYLEENYDIC